MIFGLFSHNRFHLHRYLLSIIRSSVFHRKSTHSGACFFAFFRLNQTHSIILDFFCCCCHCSVPPTTSQQHFMVVVFLSFFCTATAHDACFSARSCQLFSSHFLTQFKQLTSNIEQMWLMLYLHTQETPHLDVFAE